VRLRFSASNRCDLVATPLHDGETVLAIGAKEHVEGLDERVEIRACAGASEGVLEVGTGAALLIGWSRCARVQDDPASL
jgi:hypothetical protein